MTIGNYDLSLPFLYAIITVASFGILWILAWRKPLIAALRSCFGLFGLLIASYTFSSWAIKGMITFSINLSPVFSAYSKDLSVGEAPPSISFFVFPILLSLLMAICLVRVKSD